MFTMSDGYERNCSKIRSSLEKLFRFLNLSPPMQDGGFNKTQKNISDVIKIVFMDLSCCNLLKRCLHR